MSAVQTIRAKSATSSQKARATASDKDDSDDLALAPDEVVEEGAPEPAPAPAGMGKVVDRSV